MSIHKNKNYSVQVTRGGSDPARVDFKLPEYEVVNNETGVVEYTGNKLPEAIGVAEHSNTFLEYRMWEWISTQGKIQREQYDKEYAAVEFSLDDEELEPDDGPAH